MLLDPDNTGMESAVFGVLMEAEPAWLHAARAVVQGTPTEIAAGIAQVILVTILVVVMALVAWFRCTLSYREWVANRLRTMSEQGIANPEVLIPGMRVMAETPSEGRLLNLNGVLESVDSGRLVMTLEQPTEALSNPLPLRVTAVGSGVAFRFQQSAVRVQESMGQLVVTVPLPSWVERVQRRDYFRVAASVPATLSVRDGDAFQTWAADAEDFSAGGISLLVKSAVEIGTLVRVRMPVAEMGPVAFDARVVACEALRSAAGKVRLRCQFLYLPEHTRDTLMQYCVQLQRGRLDS